MVLDYIAHWMRWYLVAQPINRGPKDGKSIPSLKGTTVDPTHIRLAPTAKRGPCLCGFRSLAFHMSLSCPFPPHFLLSTMVFFNLLFSFLCQKNFCFYLDCTSKKIYLAFIDFPILEDIFLFKFPTFSLSHVWFLFQMIWFLKTVVRSGLIGHLQIQNGSEEMTTIKCTICQYLVQTMGQFLLDFNARVTQKKGKKNFKFQAMWTRH